MRLLHAFAFCLLIPFSALAQWPVIDAVQKGHGVGREQEGIDAVRAAINAGGDVNQSDRNGWTPLLYACLECRPAIVEMLVTEFRADVRHNANSNRNTSYMDHGQNALHIAASCFIARRRADIAPGRGMSKDYVQSELDAPLKIVRTLLRAGANPNSLDADGRTPLMMAAMHGWVSVVRELLSAKADAKIRDTQGLLATNFVDPRQTEIIGLLKEAGAGNLTGRSGRTVCDAERALDRLGYDMPIIDCISGQQMREVILKFQRQRKLEPTGELDEPTKQALGSR